MRVKIMFRCKSALSAVLPILLALLFVPGPGACAGMQQRTTVPLPDDDPLHQKVAAPGEKPRDTPALAVDSSTDPGAATPSPDQGWKQSAKISGVKVDFRGVPSLKDVVIKNGPMPVSLNEISSDEMVEGQQAVFQFRLTDATGTPLAGSRMAAWLDQARDAKPADAKECHRKIQSFLQMQLSARPEVDLNTYYILALTKEPGILIIDPRVGFSSSRLYAIIDLVSPGEDWVIARNGDRLFVSMPAVAKVAAIDAMNFRVLANVDTGGKPARVVSQPDGRYIWVGNDSDRAEESGVNVINPATLEVVARIPTGKGHHEIVFAENRTAYVSNQIDGTVSIIDTETLAKLKDVEAGKGLVALVYSSAAKSVYAASRDEGKITVISAEGRSVTGSLKDKPGFTALHMTADGRWGFVANGAENVVLLFDVSSNRFVQRYDVGRSPDQLGLTTSYLYVRSKDDEHIKLIPLDGIGTTAHTAEFPAGQAPAGALADVLASSIEPSLEGNSAFVANPADKRIYFYQEGMAAPMMSMEGYGRTPKAVKVLDRSIHETETGVYSVGLRLPQPGTYDVPVFVESPAISYCFQFTVKPNPFLKKKSDFPVYLRADSNNLQVSPGKPVQVSFHLLDPMTDKAREDLKDVQVTVLLAEGLRQLRFTAEPAGEGRYQFTFTPPMEGVYYVTVQIPSLGMKANHLSYMMVRASAENSGVAGPAEAATTQPQSR